MPLLSLFRRKTASAPDWTEFSSLAEFEEFMGLVTNYFDRKDLSYFVRGDVLVITRGEWPFEKIELSTLALLCHQSRRSRWKDIINAHFEIMQRVTGVETAFYERAHDYAYASSYLAVRIYPNEYIAGVGEESVIHRRVAEDISAVLVLDFPFGVCNLRPETTLQWNRTNEELFDLGFANLREKYPSTAMMEKIHRVKMWFINGENFFVANKALELSSLPIPQGTFGALVGLPNRHTVLVYPIDHMGVVDALQPFIVVLRGLFKDGPGSISRSLYWCHKGALIKLPYMLNEDELEFNPPPAFLEMMDQLPPQ